ncbi:MAG: hypothetical protein NZ898_12950, partial [Myxococcota bacterium]|nr:hypothetical protein [Myxococcota bacterium]
ARQVLGLLGDCDLVKFARLVPAPQQCMALYDAAVAIVRATVPSAPAAAVVAPSLGATGSPGGAP